MYSKQRSSTRRTMTEEKVQKFREKHQIKCIGQDIPDPIRKFADGNFPDYIARYWFKRFEKPLPIQSQVWPIAAEGRDLVGIAQTGSGKTLAYVIPAILHIIKQNSTRPMICEPKVLVLAPTRELALQIRSVFVELERYSGVYSCCIYGGSSKRYQLEEYHNGAEVIIATPGRLNDFLRSKDVSVKQITFLILDEADRMLDMGFNYQISEIIEQIESYRQTLMFSATWPEDIQYFAETYLEEYVQIKIGSNELEANSNIKQVIDVIDESAKEKKLSQLLNEFTRKGRKTLIFAATKVRVNEVTEDLNRKGFYALSIHGGKTQTQRNKVLEEFRGRGHCKILVATDVAARGLDIDDIKYVVNYDFPYNLEDYVHRIGRTGRSNRHGTAITFFTAADRRYAIGLCNILKDAKQLINPLLQKVVDKYFYGGITQTYSRKRSINHNENEDSEIIDEPQRKKRQIKTVSKNKKPQTQETEIEVIKIITKEGRVIIPSSRSPKVRFTDTEKLEIYRRG